MVRTILLVKKYGHQITRMEQNLQELSSTHWLLDFRFLLSVASKGGEEGIREAQLEDRLETRYVPELIPLAYDSLRYSYDWLVRNWDYFLDVGMIRRENAGTAIENSLIYALHHFSTNLPFESLPLLPDMPPNQLVTVAQKYIDAERMDDLSHS